jgi:hypothetical protein
MNTRAARADAPELCFVCGLDLRSIGFDYPWEITGNDPTFTFCPRFGAEFGYQDCTLEAARKARAEWAARGYAWDEGDRMPPDWNHEKQLADLPERVR